MKTSRHSLASSMLLSKIKVLLYGTYACVLESAMSMQIPNLRGCWESLKEVRGSQLRPLSCFYMPIVWMQKKEILFKSEKTDDPVVVSLHFQEYEDDCIVPASCLEEPEDEEEHVRR